MVATRSALTQARAVATRSALKQARTAADRSSQFGLPPLPANPPTRFQNTPVFIQIQDTGTGGGQHPMCDFVNGSTAQGVSGTLVHSGDFAFFLPSSLVTGHNLFPLITRSGVTRVPSWHRWPLAQDNSGTGGSSSYTAAEKATNAGYGSIGTIGSNTLFAYNPEASKPSQGATENSTLDAEYSAMATYYALAVTDGAALSPAVNIAWTPDIAGFSSFVATVGPLIPAASLMMLQVQTYQISTATFKANVQPLLDLALGNNTNNPNHAKVGLQMSFAKGNLSNIMTCLNSLDSSHTPDVIGIITEPPSGGTASTYVADLGAFLQQLRPLG